MISARNLAAERLVRGQWSCVMKALKATSSLVVVSAVSSTTHLVSETCVKPVNGTSVWPGTKQQNDMNVARGGVLSPEEGG